MKNKSLILISILLIIPSFTIGMLVGYMYRITNEDIIKNRLRKEIAYEILSEAKEGRIFFYNKIMKVIPRDDGGITLKEVNDGK